MRFMDVIFFYPHVLTGLSSLLNARGCMRAKAFSGGLSGLRVQMFVPFAELRAVVPHASPFLAVRIS